ncbi:MAG: anaerobic ribonucleoside-triphosphate reductase [Candidatus Alcyoniella australis]|nr:anaerobic ribonucleoside-triphosphate reductase [Candidatus Alcyoniella australis]
MSKQGCGAKTEVYSRVVGYYRPVQQWNKGKREEYLRRRPFNTEPNHDAGKAKTSVDKRRANLDASLSAIRYAGEAKG